LNFLGGKMRKLLLICSAVALFYGDYVWGMDSDESELYENPWENEQSKSTSNQKTLARLERQKRELQRLKEEFENNQKESEKLRKEFRKEEIDSNQNSFNQSHKELLNLYRQKIEKYQKALQESQQLLAEEREKNRLAEEKIEELQQKLENIRLEDINSNEKTISSTDVNKQQETVSIDEVHNNTSESSQIHDLLDKAMNPNECEKLVRGGTFVSILKKYSDSYDQTIRDIIADQLKKVGGIITETVYINGTATWHLPISRLISRNQERFKDPSFVIKLKPGFAQVSKLYENDKNSEIWIPFAIVKNLKNKEPNKNTGFSFAKTNQNTSSNANTGFSFGNGNNTTKHTDLFKSYYPGSNFHLGAAKVNTTNLAQPQLFKVIEKGNLSDINKAIKDGANVNEADRFGWTPLHLAAYNGSLEIVKLLVVNGADINTKTYIGERTPLYVASLNQHQDIVDYLKSKFNNQNSIKKTLKRIQTPLKTDNTPNSERLNDFSFDSSKSSSDSKPNKIKPLSLKLTDKQIKDLEGYVINNEKDL
jgi:hypothetical protein